MIKKEIDGMLILSLIIALILYIGMIVINVLANLLPINKINTGAVSYKYPNLFQPTGQTFSIWGIIYLLLLVYLVLQFVLIGTTQSSEVINTYIMINLIFAATSLINGLWILSWHYNKLFLSVLLMALLLSLLAIVSIHIPEEDLFTRIAFSVYFGWITVATIANITIFLVKLGIPNFDKKAVFITVVILLIGLIISSFWILSKSDLAYALVILWAYGGIFLRHYKAHELNRKYPLIYITTLLSMMILFMLSLTLFF
jgi:hypothetical protein